MTLDTKTLEQEGLPALPRVLAKRYELGDELGRGGMGVVFRCVDKESGARRAAKLLTGNLAEDKAEIRRFAQEAKSLTRFQHPNILRIFDFGLEGRYPFLITELCLTGQGKPGSLADLLAAAPNRQLSGKQLDDLLPPVIGALADLHNAGLVHRDIKPGNILLHQLPDGETIAKLSDFGLVALTGDQHLREMVEHTMSMEQESAKERALVGTYAYMSPEQKKGEVVDARSDVYSLGLMLYRLSTGYERVSFALPSEIADDLPPWIDVVVKASVDMDKAERVASAEELFALLPADYQRRIPRQIKPAKAPTAPPHPPAAESDAEPQAMPMLQPLPVPTLSSLGPAEAGVAHRLLPWLVGSMAAVAALLVIAVVALFVLRQVPQAPPPDTRTLAQRLASPAVSDLQEGLRRVQRLPPGELELLHQELDAVMRHEDETIRRMAVTIIGEKAQEQPQLQRLVIARLHDRDETVVIYALQAMRGWLQVPAEAVPAVHACFAEASGAVRGEAAKTLDNLDVPADARYADYLLHASKTAELAELGEAALPVLRDALSSSDPVMQQRALDVFAMLGATAAPLVSELVLMLGSKERELQRAASQVLRGIGPAALPKLMAVLHEGNDFAKVAALEFLLASEPALTPPWVPFHIHRHDVQALVAIGPAALPELITSYGQSDPNRRRTILAALAKLGPDAAPAAPMLAEVLDTHHRESGGDLIIEALAAMGPQAAAARPVLLRILVHGRDARAVLTAGALRAIGVPADRENLPYFLWMARYGTGQERLLAVQTLASVGRDSAQAMVLLVDLLATSEHADLVQAAREALVGMGARAVPALRERLGRTRMATDRILETLALIGPDARGAMDDLIKLTTNPDHAEGAIRALAAIGEPAINVLIESLSSATLREAAAQGLGAIGQPALLRLRNELTYTSSRDVRHAVVKAICQMGEAATPAIPELAAALSRRDLYEPVNVLDSLAMLGPTGAPLLDAIAPLAADRQAPVRRSAISAMAAIGGASAVHLGGALASDFPDVREAALVALARLGPAAAGALPSLQRFYDANSIENRELVVRIVGRMGAARPQALPLLIKALSDNANNVRLLAMQVLQDIGPDAAPALDALEAARDRESIASFRTQANNAIRAIRRE